MAKIKGMIDTQINIIVSEAERPVETIASALLIEGIQ